MLIIV